MPTAARSGQERMPIQSYVQKFMEGSMQTLYGQLPGMTPRQAPSSAPCAPVPGRQALQKDKSQLKQALRNRGGAAEVKNSNNGAGTTPVLSAPGRQTASKALSLNPDRDREGRPSSVGTSRDRRPSWAPSATSMVEGAAVHLSRMVEAVRAAGTEPSAPAGPCQADLCQSLQEQLSNWFIAFSQRYDGRIPPRLTSVAKVHRGEMGSHRLQATLIWRGLEIHVELQELPGSTSVTVADAWTEVSSDGFTEVLASALASTRGQPLEALLESLLDEEAESDEENPEEVPSFSTWLDGRAPLLRFGKWEHKAWDFPPSREEKTELLILNLLNAQRPDRAASPPRRGPRWSYASSTRGG